jgi:transposase
MIVNHYIGFDVHKKTNYCVKMADGQIIEEGKLRATHDALRQWAGRRREPWRGAMEATLFSGWIYDTLKPFAAELQMGHPAMMKAIGASKKKNDKIDARKTADLVRCNLPPECYVAPAEMREMRELRRLLRYRNLVVAQAVRMKNKMSGLLMEVGAEYNKQQLHVLRVHASAVGSRLRGYEGVEGADRPDGKGCAARFHCVATKRAGGHRIFSAGGGSEWPRVDGDSWWQISI